MQDLRTHKIEGGYGVVYCDPPWRFKTYSAKGLQKGAEQHYPTMTLAQLRALPVKEVASPNAWLAMWATWPCLPQALDLMQTWGFTYKSGGAWAKQSSTGKHWQFGTGYLFRSASEILLLGARGSPRWLSRKERNLWVAPVREHSRKPDGLYDMLERATTPGPRLELFSRSNREGWSSWGLDVGRFDEGS